MENNTFVWETSRRSDGDMRDQSMRSLFFKKRNINPQNVFLLKQIHSNRVVFVDEETDISQEADGMIANVPGFFLGVLTADCVPVVFFETEKKLWGIAHAGWKGITQGIIKNLIAQMILSGSDSTKLNVSIGPHIGSCCYSVLENRAHFFLQKTDANEQIVRKDNGQFFLDIGMAVYDDLISQGIRKEHIDSRVFCTSCDKERFFSFRRDSKESFGEMITFIGMRN